MKVLLCHNYYQQPGGEDMVFAEEGSLLESYGHEVSRFTLHNDSIRQMSPWAVSWRTLWNRQVYTDIRALIRRQRPDVVHCTNTFPLISPAVFYASRAERVPVVLSLHNYRLLCVNGQLLREGRPCESCLGRVAPWPGVVHGCYRGSRAASAAVAAMLTVHRLLKTWSRAVDLYCALSEFTRQKFIAFGFPAWKIAVKPNFVAADPSVGSGQGADFVFVGRLSPEKGIATLLKAWSRLPGPLRLTILGDGPAAADVRQAAQADARITWRGWLPPREVQAIVGQSKALIMPSLWYEGLPRTIIEAFAKGTPAIVSRMGAMAELIDDGRTGLHFEPGHADDLVTKVRQLVADPERLAAMRQAARAEYEQRYTPQHNYRMLMEIYGQAAANAERQSKHPRPCAADGRRTFDDAY
jgi:glycosyltransferase involved in cell wall biosynthesis